MRLLEHRDSRDRRKPIMRQEPEVDEDGIEIVQQTVAIEHHGKKWIIRTHIRVHNPISNYATNLIQDRTAKFPNPNRLPPSTTPLMERTEEEPWTET